MRCRIVWSGWVSGHTGPDFIHTKAICSVLSNFNHFRSSQTCTYIDKSIPLILFSDLKKKIKSKSIFCHHISSIQKKNVKTETLCTCRKTAAIKLLNSQPWLEAERHHVTLFTRSVLVQSEPQTKIACSFKRTHHWQFICLWNKRIQMVTTWHRLHLQRLNKYCQPVHAGI